MSDTSGTGTGTGTQTIQVAGGPGSVQGTIHPVQRVMKSKLQELRAQMKSLMQSVEKTPWDQEKVLKNLNSLDQVRAEIRGIQAVMKCFDE